MSVDFGMLASLVFHIFEENPLKLNTLLKLSMSSTSSLIQGDEGWLGNWWLGFVIVGSLTLIIAPFLALFPRIIPEAGVMTDAKYIEKELENSEKNGIEFITETKECLLRLIRNKVYMWSLFSLVVALLVFEGFGTFFSKYLEFQFRQNASDSGLSNLGTSIGTGLGILISGLLISKFKFRARTLAAWSVFNGVLGVGALIAFGFLACPQLELHGVNESVQGWEE